MRLKIFLYFITSFLITNQLTAQVNDFGIKLNENSYSGKYFLTDLSNDYYGTDTLDKISNNTKPKKKKSPGLAFIYSLFVPGLGQLYTDRFDVGKYFLISEVSLWLGYAAFTIYGDWLLNDAYEYAKIHAGINPDGKDDDFFLNIANYDNVEQYNNERLLYGEYDKIYYPELGYGFYWDNIENRKKYRGDKLSADRIHNDRLFIVGAILLNHIVSAISALTLTNNYNSDIPGKSGSINLNTDIIKFGDRVDGIKLKLVKWF